MSLSVRVNNPERVNHQLVAQYDAVIAELQTHLESLTICLYTLRKLRDKEAGIFAPKAAPE